MKDFFILFVIKVFVWPFSKLPPICLHKLGKSLGSCAYYIHGSQRKRVMSNLANANVLNLSHDALKATTKEAFQNLYISTFEYLGIQSIRKHLTDVASCDNPEQLFELREKHQSVILVACHQANWEMAFIQGTAQVEGAVVGQAFSNAALQNWSLQLREVDKGRFIESHNAILKGMKLLKEGIPVGIAIDQAMPSSPYSYPLLGKNVFLSPTPAIWAYRTQCPILVVSTRREGTRYFTRFSKPIFANQENTYETETINIMNVICERIEESIKQNPGQYMWQHNRMQQHSRATLKKSYRHDVILIILPSSSALCERLFPELQQALRDIFPKAFISLMSPTVLKNCEYKTFYYKQKEELFIESWEYQLVLTFEHYQEIKKHFMKLATFSVADCSKCCKQPTNTYNILNEILCL